MNKSESLAKLAPALVAAQKKMGAALKDAKNPFFKSKYANLNAVIDASIPVLNEHDIAVLQTPSIHVDHVTGKTTSVIETVLLHASGEYVSSSTEIVAAKANDPQAAGSAISYARRYGLQATVTLKAEDDDAETAMNRTSKPAAAPLAETAIKTLEVEKIAEPAKRKLSFSKKAVAAAETTTAAGDDL